jgi:ATP-dependent DNA ligase
VPPSTYIRAMHPKTEISPTLPAVEKILKAGWLGQMKVHGHRAQIHLPADPSLEPIAYTRHGQPHKKLLPPEIISELRRLIKVESDWTVIDCEWLKPENKLFLFDVLKFNGENLRRLTYGERYEHLPKDFLSPHIQTLPLLRTSAKCMAVLASTLAYVEGLVFKSPTTKGFEDSSIIRCRKRPSRG